MGFIKSASAYQLKGKIFIQGYSETTVISRLHGPVFAAEENDYEALGQAVINALNECKTGIPHVPFDKYDPNKTPMIIATGMKTWKALDKASKNIDINLFTEDEITFILMRFVGNSSRNYEWIEEKKVISDLNLEHLGKALLEAFSYSENPYLKDS